MQVVKGRGKSSSHVVRIPFVRGVEEADDDIQLPRQRAGVRSERWEGLRAEGGLQLPLRRPALVLSTEV